MHFILNWMIPPIKLFCEWTPAILAKAINWVCIIWREGWNPLQMIVYDPLRIDNFFWIIISKNQLEWVLTHSNWYERIQLALAKLTSFIIKFFKSMFFNKFIVFLWEWFFSMMGFLFSDVVSDGFYHGFRNRNSKIFMLPFKFFFD